jgi:hypothetical protein
MRSFACAGKSDAPASATPSALCVSLPTACLVSLDRHSGITLRVDPQIARTRESAIDVSCIGGAPADALFGMSPGWMNESPPSVR